MAVWGQHEGEVFGEICCQCSECGWENWQTPYWWSNYANFCPQCGTKMEFIEAEEVYDEYTDTAGNLHWTGTKSGEHKIPLVRHIGEVSDERFQHG